MLSGQWQVEEERRTDYDGDGGYTEIGVVCGSEFSAMPLTVGWRGHPYQTKLAQARRLAEFFNGISMPSDGRWDPGVGGVSLAEIAQQRQQLLAACKRVLDEAVAVEYDGDCPASVEMASEVLDIVRDAVASAEGGAAC